MKINTVICEFNPFHYGHEIMLGKINDAFPDSKTVCLMSGCTVQRGTFAVADKYTRAAEAVKRGAALVLELPYPWSGGSAEYFANGAVGLINRLFPESRLCFGSESGDIEKLTGIARNMSSTEFERRISEQASEYGEESYIVMRNRVYSELYGREPALRPNDILAVEYIKAQLKNGCEKNCWTYKREPGYTASEARRSLEEGDINVLHRLVPPDIASECLRDGMKTERLSGMLLGYFRLWNGGIADNTADMAPGMAERFIGAARLALDAEEFFSLASCKKYTDARLRRAALSCLTGATVEDLRKKPLWTTVLAIGKGGREILRNVDPSCGVEVITKPAHFRRLTGEAAVQYRLHERAEYIYSTLTGRPAGYHLTGTPYVAK